MVDIATDQAEAERVALVAAMQAMTEPAPEPGDFRPRDIVHKGDDDLETPVIVASIESAGYVYVYDRLTGERSTVSRNQLVTHLTKRGPDGLPIFKEHPTVTPVVGEHKCLLHPKGPDRARYDQLGFKTCRKGTLMSPFDVEMHMQRCHKKEWGAIKRDREEHDRLENQELQRAFIKAATLGFTGGRISEPEPVAAGRTRREKAG